MINLYEIKPGDKLLIKGGRQVVCVENMEDGQWIEIEDSNGRELVHSQDIVEHVTQKET
jgi:preprotein translocase subunit YajC